MFSEVVVGMKKRGELGRGVYSQLASSILSFSSIKLMHEAHPIESSSSKYIKAKVRRFRNLKTLVESGGLFRDS